MKTALIAIATAPSYRDYARDMFRSARKFFPPHDPFVFTDEVMTFLHQSAFYTKAKGYPRETLMRYHTMLEAECVLSNYDQIFYVDSDMEFVNLIGDEIFSNGLTATIHPGYVGRRGTPETRETSTAFTPNNTAYYCGGFQGGNARAYLGAAKVMAGRIDQDERSGITAIWQDESQWNKLLADEPPAKILSPSFCFPENYNGGYGWSADTYPPKLVALDKKKRGNHPRFQ